MAPLHFPNPPDSGIMDEIARLTGTRLDIEWVPDGIYTDKLNTALSTNTVKQVNFVKRTDYMIAKSAIRSGAFWEIGPYLQDYPNLARLKKEILEQGAVDGKIYGLYTERPSSRQGLIIRKDWLDRLGLQPPGTLDELYEVLRRFTWDDPDGNGRKDTVGLADRNDLVYGAFKTLSSYFGTPNNWERRESTFVPEFETQAYIDTMDFMRKLFREELINTDFAITSKEQQRDLLIRGVAGVYVGSMTDVQRLLEQAKAYNPKTEFTLVNRIMGPLGSRVWSIPNYNGLFLFSRKTIPTEDELKRILAFFDRTMEKDVSNIMKYGIENVHYTLSNGKVVLPEETYALRVSEVSPLYTLMIADINNPNVLPIESHEPMADLADRLSNDNEKFTVPDPTVNLDSKTFDERGVELTKIVTDATYQYILGFLDLAGFQDQVKRWENAGGRQVIQEYETSYRNQNEAG